MRTSHRDRRGFTLATLCAALIITCIIPSVGALNVTYVVLPNATHYLTTMDINDTSEFQFTNSDIIGENIPVSVTNVTLTAENGTPVNYNWTTQWGSTDEITFDKGNYTISYISPLENNQIQESFDIPYNVSVYLAEPYDVRNPLLAGLSSGADIIRTPENTTIVKWNQTVSFDLRFYDKAREDLLYLFGEFMIILAVLLLIPFFLMQRPPE